MHLLFYCVADFLLPSDTEKILYVNIVTDKNRLKYRYYTFKSNRLIRKYLSIQIKCTDKINRITEKICYDENGKILL